MDEKTMRWIKELEAEIEGYRQAIKDAEGALDSAEKELNDALRQLQETEDLR